MHPTKSIICCVIVTYNGEEYIEKCISSLMDNQAETYIVVIDNHSVDDSVKIVKEKFPNVHLHLMESNLGFGKANNFGLELGLQKGCSHYLLLNQDAYLEPKALDDLLALSRRNPEFSVMSPLHLDGNGKKLDYKFVHHLTDTDPQTMLFDLLVSKDTKEVYQIPRINAAVWFLSIDTLKRVGGFDPLFPHYGEDIDYINRLNFFGGKMGVCLNLFAFHDRHQKAEPRGKALYKLLYVRGLAVLKDVNKRFYLSFSILMLAYTKSFLLNLIKVRRDFWIYWGVLIPLMFKLNKIKLNRDISRKSTYAFLKYKDGYTFK